jgi:YD repeat-containing protein
MLFAYGAPAADGSHTTTVTHPRGNKDVYTYLNSEVVKIVRGSGSAHDTYGNRASVTDATGRESTTTYNVVGWVTSTVSAAGNASGGSPAQHTTTYSNFTGSGKPRTVTDPLGHVTTYGFDADQNVTDVTDADDRHTHTAYDENNQPVLVTRPDGSTQATSYDDNENLAVQTDGLAHATTYGYDDLDRQISTQDAAGRVTSRTCDGVGNVLTVVQPATGSAVSKITNTYDAANELKTVTYSDGTTHGVSYTYDNDGQRQTMTHGSGTTTYVVDSLHRTAQVTNGAGKVAKYGYNLAGDTTSITYPDGSVVNRGFDDAGLALGHRRPAGYGRLPRR